MERKITTNTIEFPVWFLVGCYGGLACCIIAITINALYTTFSQRGTTRQLAGAIVICAVAALLLLPAFVWYEQRFSAVQATLAVAEVQLALVYVALCGWFLPLSVTATYCLMALPRLSSASVQLASQRRVMKENVTTALHPPRHQSGVPAPFVFDQETPWGWLEHRGGRFQGQRLNLLHTIVTIGRDEENDIWLDDEMASRYHAELAYDKGNVYVTDCNSMNGVLVNGRRISDSVQLKPDELLEIGSHRFIFISAKREELPSELSDPLAHHIWRSSLDGLTGSGKAYNDGLPTTKQLPDSMGEPVITPPVAIPDAIKNPEWSLWSDTAEIQQTPSPQQSSEGGVIRIQNGLLAGHLFLLDQPLIMVGRSTESDIVIDDASISRIHVQFLRQVNGMYVQDVSSRNGTTINGELLVGPCLLHVGDTIQIGDIALEYLTQEYTRTVPLSLIITPRPARSLSGPMLLRLPSRPGNIRSVVHDERT